jgi:hypothetical protein
MNYFQSYFLENHNLVDYKPQQHFNYYKKWKKFHSYAHHTEDSIA